MSLSENALQGPELSFLQKRNRMITSLTNPKIKRLLQLKKKSKFREEEDVFVAEGGRMFLELPEEAVLELYVTEAFLTAAKPSCGQDFQREDLTERLKQFPNRYETVSEEVFAKISDTVTPQGVLAVVKRMHYRTEDLLADSRPLLLMIEDLQDPGNLGTMFRTAEAAGVSGILMSRDTVDIYNPKTVRSTMGSIFRMPFLYADSLKETIDELKRRGITVYAAALRHSVSYTEADYGKGCAILIGNEGKGLKRETIEAASRAVSIPMQGKVESLNAAVSAAVLLYEARRQRKTT